MGPLHTLSAPPPALYVAGDRPPVANAYFAVTIDAAVDLLEAREYRSLSRSERVAKAQAEQQGFLDGFFDPGLGTALDLRVAADPKAATPISVALLGRVWGADADGVAARAEGLRSQVRAAIPRQVTATPVEDPGAVARMLTPFPGTQVDSAVITRHELTGLPSRPDAGVSYYYSAVPFNWSDNDWSAVYAALAASPVPVVLSVAVLPMQVPAPFSQTLLTLATFYGRLAREGEPPGGHYPGQPRLAPDAFAVDAEKAFRDYARRLAQKAFALRIQVSAPRQLPPGLVETIAGAISPGERSGSFLEHQRAASAYDVRRPASVAERRLAEYNLNVINFGMLTGRQDIWGRPDPPDPQLAMLSVLGDARDAACAFRFPIAADGIVPGFRVRRGHSGQAEAHAADGRVIRLGQVSGTGENIAVPLRSLTRHALIAGSAGSGKTTTGLEILRQLWADHQIPFLVIEPVNSDADDYRKLAGTAGFESLEVITVGDEGGRPLRFNPFEVPAGVLVGEHTASLLACFKAAFGLLEPLPSVYQDALNLTYLRSGFLPAERPAGSGRAWPTVVEFFRAMREVTSGLSYAGAVRADIEAASIRRAGQLVRGAAGSAFLTDQPNDIGRLLDHPVILELKSLGTGEEQPLMMALLLNAITEHCRSTRGASAGLVHVTLVEEAHRLLARSSGAQSAAENMQARERAAEAFANALAENGKYGEGIVIAGQIPGQLVADAVKNTSLKVMHRLTAGDDRRYLGETVGMDEAQQLFATRLRTGEALLYSDELAEAAHVSITPTLPPGPPSPGLVPPAARAPLQACELCRAQCTYRGAALSMVNDPKIVDRVSHAVAALEQPGLTAAENQARWSRLTGGLRAEVGAFAALPAAAPGRDDAALCLFLHVLASRSMRFAPAWPAALADRLGEQPGSGSVDGPGRPSAYPAEPGELGPAGDRESDEQRTDRPRPGPDG
ncbi:MAG TPA: hypothetical protein VGD91_10935 [Trebonia sp.]